MNLKHCLTIEPLEKLGYLLRCNCESGGLVHSHGRKSDQPRREVRVDRDSEVVERAMTSVVTTAALAQGALQSAAEAASTPPLKVSDQGVVT